MYIVNEEETDKGQPIWEVRENFFFFIHYIHMNVRLIESAFKLIHILIEHVFGINDGKDTIF